MGDLSKHFNRYEFMCRGLDCCDHSAPVTSELIIGLQKLRELAGAPIHINSGFRCNKHNRKIDGSFESFHTLGMAADITCEDLSPRELAKLAEKIEHFKKGGIGVYSTWLHLDVRTIGKARW